MTSNDLLELQKAFSHSVHNDKVRGGSSKAPAPFSLRLTREERDYLEAQAGNKPLGRYIRDQLLGDKVRKRSTYRKPSLDDQNAAKLLASLKHSRVAPNLNQIAKAANCGSLDLDDDVREQLEHACAAVIAMRNALFIALGLKTEG